MWTLYKPEIKFNQASQNWLLVEKTSFWRNVFYIKSKKITI
jgi:hypothetical protein